MFNGNYYLINGTLQPTSNVEFTSNQWTYEVLRIIDGKPLFWDEHWKRLKHSLVINKWDLMLDENTQKLHVKQLVDANKILNCNLRIQICPLHTNQYHIEMGLSPTLTPNQQEYQNGVAVGMIHLERPTPNAKNVHTNLKTSIQQKLTKDKLWEVLLVNHNNEITEGSRTNIFFIHHNKLITPPAAQVLPGITREIIIQTAQEAGIEIKEQTVAAKDITTFQHVFLTGTSPGAIAVQKIENQLFDVDSEVLKNIWNRYNEKMKESIQIFEWQ